MTPEEIVAKFADALKQFDPIYRKPYDTDLTQIREVVVTLLIQIQYDKTGGTHNLIGLICYGAEFVKPTRVGAYDATINDDATAVVCVRMEATHKANRTNRDTYETARRETAQFILDVVEYTSVRELRDTKTFYTDVAPKALLAHLQAGCTGCHYLYLLALHN